MMPVMLFATVLYFCVFAVLTHRSAQTAAMQPGGTTVVLDAGTAGRTAARPAFPARRRRR